ncbi:MAG: universal stress protein [Candidatus Aminicenantes bacterium]
MLPFKKILWPTDFSEPSFEALKAANELALNFSSKLYVVHVIAPVPVVAAPPGPTSFNVGVYRTELEESAKKSVQEIIEKKISDKIEAQPVVVHGMAADEIVRVAEEEKVDLVVIATHGETGFRHFIFGSVAEKVVRTSPVPVLTIRAPEKKE